MKAVVFHGEGDVRVEEVPEPTLTEPDDVLVKVRTAAICGSDLHVIEGRVPGVFEGATIGHELVGEVVAVGDAVTRFGVGDEVIASFQVADGSCEECARGRFNLCAELGVYGYGIFVGDLGGAQAEYVRVPHADVNLLALPPGLADDKAIWVGDVLTTAWYAAGLADITPGGSVAIVGAGPVGLCAVMSALHRGGDVVVIDRVPERLALAEELGARAVNSADVDPTVAMESMFPGGRANSVIESVGLLPALQTAIDVTASGGTLSVIGVHTNFTAELPLSNMFTRALKVHFGGSCNVQGTWEDALGAVSSGSVDPARLVSHRMALADAVEGYRIFGARQATKVLLDVSG